MSAPLFGLVLTGGKSRRMGKDKATMEYHGMPQALWTCKLLDGVCDEVYVSARPGQDAGTGDAFPVLEDKEEGGGPMVGILAAMAHRPDAAWLIVACDLPLLDEATLKDLVAKRDAAKHATAYRSSHDGLPEPLCAIYEPSAGPGAKSLFDQGRRCPRWILRDWDKEVLLLDLPGERALDNFNTPEDLETLPKDKA